MTEKAAATEGEPQHRRMLQRVVEPVQRCSVIVSKLAVDVRPLIRSQGDSQLNCRSAAERRTSACPIFFPGEMSLFSGGYSSPFVGLYVSDPWERAPLGLL